MKNFYRSATFVGIAICLLLQGAINRKIAARISACERPFHNNMEYCRNVHWGAVTEITNIVNRVTNDIVPSWTTNRFTTNNIGHLTMITNDPTARLIWHLGFSNGSDFPIKAVGVQPESDNIIKELEIVQPNP